MLRISSGNTLGKKLLHYWDISKGNLTHLSPHHITQIPFTTSLQEFLGYDRNNESHFTSPWLPSMDYVFTFWSPQGDLSLKAIYLGLMLGQPIHTQNYIEVSQLEPIQVN